MSQTVVPNIKHNKTSLPIDNAHDLQIIKRIGFTACCHFKSFKITFNEVIVLQITQSFPKG